MRARNKKFNLRKRMVGIPDVLHTYIDQYEVFKKTQTLFMYVGRYTNIKKRKCYRGKVNGTFIEFIK